MLSGCDAECIEVGCNWIGDADAMSVHLTEVHKWKDLNKRCRNGHLLEGENVSYPLGVRTCKTCLKQRAGKLGKRQVRRVRAA